MDLNNMETINDWGKWKSTLSKAVDLGEAVGLTEKSIDNIAYKIGSTLNAAVDPENREQRVLQELWRVGDDSDRKVLAKLVVKMVETDEK
jgi:hypothetical protein